MPRPILMFIPFICPRFSSGVGLLGILGLAMSGVIYVLTYYMQLVQGYDPLGAGLRFIPFAAGMLIGATSANKFVKGLGAKSVMAIGSGGAAIILILMSWFRVDSPFWLLGTEFAVFGLFLGNLTAPVTNIIMSALPKGQTGIGSAINSSFRQISGTIGVAVLGPILGTIYTSHFLHTAAAISGLPAALVQKAGDSLGAAVGIANSGQLPAALSNALAQTARQSFMSGWHVVMLICGGIFVAGMIIILKFVPGRVKPKEGEVSSESSSITE